MREAGFAQRWKDVAASFGRLGFTAYGGPAIMGIMQAELQERRQWVTKGRFVEGLSLVNLIPGATATQLAIFLGYARGGWWGGLLAGVCFVLPGFGIMLALTTAYAALGATPLMRGALYGLGPVVLGIYLVAIYRLGRAAVSTMPQTLLAILAAAAVIWSPLGIAAILLLAGGLGVLLFHSRSLGAIILLVIIAGLSILQYVFHPTIIPAMAPSSDMPHPASLAEIATFLFKVGAFTFGGGLTMIAFIQDQVVRQFHWLTPQEFLDGLALGQFTPGPILMVAAYVGYKVAGLMGAVVGATAAFVPSFILMLAILPAFERVRKLVWTKAAMQGIGPAVIGVLAVSLFQLAPHALPDGFAVAVLGTTVAALVLWRVGTVRLMVAGAVLGIVRSRLSSLQTLKAALSGSLGLRI
jgi:chromate transporter